MSKPNLFIAGFAKAGTTVLYHYFNKHPDVYCNPYIKEPRHFSSEFFNEGHGHRQFFKNIIYKENDYLSLYKKAGDEKYILDGSVYYSYFKGVAGKIKEFNGDSRIILCIRNPIDRFNSHYMMHIRDGFTKDNIESLFKNPETSSGIDLLKAGLYSDAIREYYEIFGSDRVFIAVYDDLLANHERYYSEICDFLDIPFELNKNKLVNVSGRPKSLVLMSMIRLVKRIVPRFILTRIKFQFKTKINNIFYNKSTLTKEALPDEVRVKLVEYYKGDVEKTGELIDRDLSKWID